MEPILHFLVDSVLFQRVVDHPHPSVDLSRLDAPGVEDSHFLSVDHKFPYLGSIDLHIFKKSADGIGLQKMDIISVLNGIGLIHHRSAHGSDPRALTLPSVDRKMHGEAGIFIQLLNRTLGRLSLGRCHHFDPGVVRYGLSKA